MTLQQDSAATPVDADAPATRPMTGDEYVESLRDGREVYLHGERIEDVTTHPAFWSFLDVCWVLFQTFGWSSTLNSPAV